MRHTVHPAPPAGLGRRHEGVAPRLLRAAMGQFATGVAIVTAVTPVGHPCAVTAESLTTVSLDPPLVLVCLPTGSEAAAAVLEAGVFAVSVLSAGQDGLADRFRRGRAATWDGVAHRMRDGLPELHGALAVLACEVHEVPGGGDRTIVIGRVTAADHVDDHVPALVRHRGRVVEAPAPGRPRPPVPRVDVAIPSSLGDLRMQPLTAEDTGEVSVAVCVGEVRGTEGALLYLHRGCMPADAMGAECHRGRALDAALATMNAAGTGVVVYHRRNDGLAGCCLGGGGIAPSPGPGEVAAVRRAVRALELRDVRILGGEHTARTLAEAGVPVAGHVPLAGVGPEIA